MTNNYYRDAHGIVVVYDVTERSTFEAIDSWMEDIEKFMIHVYIYIGMDKEVCVNYSLATKRIASRKRK